MMFRTGLTLILLALGDAGSIQKRSLSLRGPVHDHESGMEFDCTARSDGFYADYQRDCRQFYRCAGGQKYAFFCNDRTRFDENINACVLEESVNCIDTNVPTFVRKVPTFDCTSRPDGYYAVTEDDCTTFHRCKKQVTTTHQCPEGTKFDERVNACVLSELAHCGGQSVREAKQPEYYDFDCSAVDDGFYSDKERDCRQFYFCHGGRKDLFYCAPGTRFDENQRCCLPEEDVKCDNNLKRDRYHPPQWLLFDCKKQKDGYYADRYRDCRQFYQCKKGDKTTFVCPPGAQFDEDKASCVDQAEGVCPQSDYDPEERQIKFRQLRTLLLQLKSLIKEKKH